ncbi:MAG: shikimate kinase [Firmicutes bacterium]|nr:shikimate kinase [Bacillota bacterium]
MKNIVLIGMPGCGKITIGINLAKKLDLEFCDIDEYIETNEGKSIKDIFKKGEYYFRGLESKAVKEVVKCSDRIISTGGGVVKLKDNMISLKENGVIIFINRPLEHIISDINIFKRPIIKDGKEKLYSLYKERYNLYKEYCDIEVLNNTSIKETVEDILKYVKDYL